MIRRYQVIGLENGTKRILTWLDGELTGDEDLKVRFRQAWEALQLRLPTPENEMSHSQVVEVMNRLFEEVLDLESSHISTSEELQVTADMWNKNEDGRHYAVADIREIEERQNWNNHHGPPYEWEEIESCMARRQRPLSDVPFDQVKCIECLQPMKWIWFSSSPSTWGHLCGRAGWTAICEPCKAWRPCRVEVLN